MDKNVVIASLLYYTYSCYKRIIYKCMKSIKYRHELIFDMKNCKKLLKNMQEECITNECINNIMMQIERICHNGTEINLNIAQLSSNKLADIKAVKIMYMITNDILRIVKGPFFRFKIDYVQLLLMAIHNFPRVYLDDNYSIGDIPANYSLSFQEASESAHIYLGNKYNRYEIS